MKTFASLFVIALLLGGCQNSMGQYTGFTLPPGCSGDVIFGAGLGGTLSGHIKCAAAPFVQPKPVMLVPLPTPGPTEPAPVLVAPAK